MAQIVTIWITCTMYTNVFSFIEIERRSPPLASLPDSILALLRGPRCNTRFGPDRGLYYYSTLCSKSETVLIVPPGDSEKKTRVSGYVVGIYHICGRLQP